jgi:dTDP-glucose 4,6-dehydratase
VEIQVQVMKLFVTGGTGVFGKAILRHLQALYSVSYSNLPDEVVVLTRSPEKFIVMHPEFSDLPWLKFHKGNIEEPLTLPCQERFTHILHAAADLANAALLNDLQRYDQIVNGTRNLLDFAVACGAHRFLFISSGSVYGAQPTYLDCIPENWHGIPDPLNPANAYGLAKRAAEHLCALYREIHGVNTIVARCFAFVGQDIPLNAHFAIGNFIRDALWRNEIIVHGDGTPLRSYLALNDMAHWLITILIAGKSGSAYNVGSDEALSIANLAYQVRDLVAPDKQVRILDETDRNRGRNCYVPDIGLALRELGLKVYTPLDKAIVQTAERAKIKSPIV